MPGNTVPQLKLRISSSLNCIPLYIIGKCQQCKAYHYNMNVTYPYVLFNRVWLYVFAMPMLEGRN